MAIDYGEREREFIDGLEADTGRSLESWLTAITQSGIRERNQIIDWLRLEGFTFSNASWIERIHHNGGRLIYGDARVPPPLPTTLPPPVRLKIVAPPAVVRPPSRDAEVASPRTDRDALARAAGFPGGLTDVLAGAKGLRPLAELILREIAAALPGVRYEARDPIIEIAFPQPFAALVVGPKRLLLYAVFESGVAEVRPGAAVGKHQAPYAQMLALDDARRIDRAFREAIVAAAKRVNG